MSKLPFRLLPVIALTAAVVWGIRLIVGYNLPEVNMYKFNNKWVYCETYTCYDTNNYPLPVEPKDVYEQSTDTCISPRDWKCPLLQLPHD